MKLALTITSLVLIFVTGCTSLDLAHKQDVAQVRTTVSEEMITVNETIQEIQGNIEELQQQMSRLSQNQQQQAAELKTVVKETQKQLSSDTKKQLADFQTRIQNLEKNQQETEQDLARKLNIVLEEVTKENKELRQQIGTLSKSIGFPADEGYYVVAEGDTISGIAALFGVSKKSLIQANDLKDPNKIHAGQKLIIPR